MYKKMFELLSSEQGIIPEEVFTIINDYTNCRENEMNSKIPVYLFLKYPYNETVGNGFRQCAIRYNPLTKLL